MAALYPHIVVVKKKDDIERLHRWCKENGIARPDYDVARRHIGGFQIAWLRLANEEDWLIAELTFTS
jgi:hypothetical protein